MSEYIVKSKLIEWIRDDPGVSEDEGQNVIFAIESGLYDAHLLEKERDELRKRIGTLEQYMHMIVRTTVQRVSNSTGGEAYSLSGHMNAVEYAKHMLRGTPYEQN